MNRIVIFGLAVFFAIVGIALIGGDSKVMAFGHHGCCNGCNGGGCHGGCHARCHGGCHHRCHGRCHGGCNGGSCGGGGCGGGGCCGGGGYASPEKQAPMPAQAPAK